MSDKMIPLFIVCLWVIFLLVVVALPPSPRPDVPEPEYTPSGLYVVRTYFFDRHGVHGSVPYEGNIYREGGPYMKCFVWSDGVLSWQHNPAWIDETYGPADPNLRGNERPARITAGKPELEM